MNRQRIGWRRLNSSLMPVLMLGLAACTHGGDDGRAATTPATPQPPAQPSPPQPPAEPTASCWDTLAGIDDDVGCQRVSFDVAAGDLEIYEARLAYPDDFEFNGFSVAGPLGTVLGTMGLDPTFDDVSDYTVLFSSLSDELAYADVLADGVFSPDFEPVFEHLQGNEFLLRLPFGGDVDPDTFFVPAAARITLSLREELMTASPPTGSSFTVSGTLTSVDPETDAYDDGLGAAPTVTAFTTDVAVMD